MRDFSRAACALLTGAVLGLAGGASAFAQVAHQPARQLQYDWFRTHPQDGDFQSYPLRPLSLVRAGESQVVLENGVYVINGPDGNVTLLVGADGVVVVDTQREALGERLMAEIDKVRGPRPIRVLISTSGDPERIGAAGIVRERGEQLFGSTSGGGVLKEAVHIAHESVVHRLAGVNGGDVEGDPATWPKQTFLSDSFDFPLNGEAVQIIHVPRAHTDGDSFVHFRDSDVIAAGDLWDTTRYPRIDRGHGGSIDGLIAGLARIVDLAVPGAWQEGGTLVVPGRGRVGDESEVVEYRDMLIIIRDRIKSMADRGMSLQQVKAQRPTFDFDGRYGAVAGPWTTDMFVEAVYAGVRPERRGRAGR